MRKLLPGFSLFLFSFLLSTFLPHNLTLAATPPIPTPTYYPMLTSTPSPVPTLPLADSLEKNKTADELEDICNTFSPKGAAVTPAQSVIDNTHGLYRLCKSDQTPEKGLRNIPSFFTYIGDLIRGLFGLSTTADTEAIKFANVQLPREVGEQVLSQRNKIGDNNLAQKDSNDVLGILNQSGDPLVKAVKLRQCANLPLGACKGQIDPTITQTPGLPPPPPGGVCDDANCPLGTGYCSIANLVQPQYFGDKIKAEQASRICQAESRSNPFALNLGCLKTAPSLRTQEYSVGLFQISLWWDDPVNRCPGALINKVVGPPISCSKGPKFDQCTNDFYDADRNIRSAIGISGRGANWGPWSTKSCAINVDPTQCLKISPPPPIPLANCPGPEERILVPDSEYKMLKRRQYCITPTMIVLHWSAAWTNADATYNVLNTRNLSCQFATDQYKQLQMLEFYKDKVEKASCVGGTDELGRAYNDYAINFEITGVYFNEVIRNADLGPDYYKRYQELVTETNQAVATTCWLLKQYNIPKTQIFSHFELTPGKLDASQEYEDYFLRRVQNECI